MLHSVVVPTVGRVGFLLRALASLRAQRDARWEALVVDDGDGGGAAAAEGLGDDRIRAMRTVGRGQVDARNVGITVARGDAVVWLDDDDWLEAPDHLARCATVLASGEALVHATGWLVATDGAGRETGRRAFELGADPASLRRDNTILTAGLAYPRDLHRRLGLLDRSLGGYHDWDWHLRVVDAGVRLHRLDGRGVAYRQHAGSGSGTDSSGRRRDFEAFRAKHGLAISMKNHAEVLGEHGDPASV